MCINHGITKLLHASQDRVHVIRLSTGLFLLAYLLPRVEKSLWFDCQMKNTDIQGLEGSVYSASTELYWTKENCSSAARYRKLEKGGTDL